MHSDWLKIVMWFLLANQSALFQHCIVMLLQSWFMTSAPLCEFFFAGFGTDRTARLSQSKYWKLYFQLRNISRYLLLNILLSINVIAVNKIHSCNSLCTFNINLQSFNYLMYPAVWYYKLFHLVWTLNPQLINQFQGSGCGSVGRVVTSDTRGPRYESNHRQKIIIIEHLYTVNCVL